LPRQRSTSCIARAGTIGAASAALARELEHLDPLREDREHLVDAREDVERLEQRLLLRRAHVEVDDAAPREPEPFFAAATGGAKQPRSARRAPRA
jgi:hypothetical protein